MSKTLIFAKRNLKEIIRDPLSTIFCIFLPSVLFIVMQLIMNSMNTTIEETPQFELNTMTVGMMVFSFSFLSIFGGNIIALDRESSFILRLKASPMKSINFILGYTLPFIIVAFIQEIMIIICALILGLPFSYTLLLLPFVLLPLSLLFIGIGILFGILVNSKAVGGIASLVPTFTALLGGIFFPIDLLKGTFPTICYSLPFANIIKVGRCVIDWDFTNFTQYILVSLIYVILCYTLSIIIFRIKLKNDKI